MYGNGNGMIITSDYGSFPHSLLSTSKKCWFWLCEMHESVFSCFSWGREPWQKFWFPKHSELANALWWASFQARHSKRRSSHAKSAMYEHLHERYCPIPPRPQKQNVGQLKDPHASTTTIWGWFLPPAYGNIEDSFLLGLLQRIDI